MLKQARLLLVIVAIGGISLCAQADASILAGGGFDDANDLAAWTIGGNSLPVISGDAFGLAPQAGDGYLAFTGNNVVENGFAYQDVVVTSGQWYRLEFYWGGRGIGGAQVTVTADDGGALVSEEFTANTIGIWTLASYDFQAGNSPIRIQFQETSDNSVNKGPGIDSVSLTAIPEPATFIVWSLLGGLGIFVTSWRRR